MARLSTIAKHPKKREIEKAILRGDSLRHMAAHFDVSVSALRRYRDTSMPEQIEVAKERDVQLGADNMSEMVTKLFADAKEFFDAAKRELTDPDGGGITWSPHATDVKLIYTEQGEDGKRKRRRGTLQNLLDRIEDAGVQVEDMRYRIADPRSEAARYIDQCRRLVETLAKLHGQIQENVTVSMNNPTFVQIQAAVLQVVPKDARPKVAAKLLELTGEG